MKEEKMELSDMFTDFGIITPDEFSMLFNEVVYKLKYCRIVIEAVKLYAKDLITQLPNDGTDETEGVTDGENFHIFIFFHCINGKLHELVNAKNPKMKIYEMADKLYMGFTDVLGGDDDFEISGMGKKSSNMFLALVMYVVIYYRYRDIPDYSKYVLPVLHSRFAPMIQDDGGVGHLKKLIEVLPPHDETLAQLERLENVPEENVRQQLVEALAEISQLKMRIVDLEDELKDAKSNSEARGEEGETDGDGRFYKRKLQLKLLQVFMRRAGIDITRNKTAASILMSNLLHIANHKSIQKMLSEQNPYLRASDHSEACAEVNGILKVLESPFRITVKTSKTAQKGETPSKDYSEILKSYKNTGE